MITENDVQAEAERAFFPDFVFRSPQRIGGRELTDVLILFDDVALVIQCKARTPVENEDSRRAILWAANAIDDAMRQISGAARTIQEGRLQEIINTRRGIIPFDRTRHPWVYGLIILHHVSEPYVANDLSPSLDHAPIPVHVLSFQDFRQLCRILDTPMDLINYFESRSEVLSPVLRPEVHDEQRIFLEYLEHLEELAVTRMRRRGQEISADQMRPYAQELRLLASGQHPHRHMGRAVDYLIDRLHDFDPALGIPGGNNRRPDRATADDYARIATELAKIPRARRIALGRRFLAAVQRGTETDLEQRVLIHSRHRKECILYVVSPLRPTERERRRRELMALTRLAKAYKQAERALGIATEPLDYGGRSFDVTLMESQPADLGEAELSLARELFGEQAEPLLDTD